MYFKFISTFVLSYILLTIFVKLSNRLGFIDTPNSRSTHKKAIPSSAGIAFFIAVFIIFLLSENSIYQQYKLSLWAIFFVFLLGVYDDRNALRARYKVIFITLVTVLSCFDGLIINNIGVYFGYHIPLSLNWIAIPLTMFFILGFTNAFNLIDGLDGLAGSVAITLFSSLWFIGYQNNDAFLMALPALFIPAILSFLLFNWNPAKAFMGDSGSLILGFVISLLSIKALDYVPPVTILYLLAVPIIDTLIIMTRRKKYHTAIFSPDKNHAHHVLLNHNQNNVKKTVIIIALIQVTYTLFGLTLAIILPQELSVLFFIINIIFWYFVLTKLCINHSRLMAERFSASPKPKRSRNYIKTEFQDKINASHNQNT